VKFANDQARADWARGIENNQDPYGGAIYKFAEQWADEMERLIADGKSVADIAQDASSTVNRRPGFGITGFMYGAAVSILSPSWAHGDELRRWHNLDTQIGDEGERANESGGTLNPAILSVGIDRSNQQ